MRHRLAESERYGFSIQRLLDEYMKLSNSLRVKLNEIWKNFAIVVKNVDEVPIDEINQYQLLVIKNLIGDKYTPDRVDAFEA